MNANSYVLLSSFCYVTEIGVLVFFIKGDIILVIIWGL